MRQRLFLSEASPDCQGNKKISGYNSATRVIKLSYCLFKRIEADALDSCSQALRCLAILPVERDDLTCQRYGLFGGQPLGNDLADPRRASALAADDRVKAIIGTEE